MRFKCIVLILFLFRFVGFSQNAVNPNFLFINHLIESNKQREALFLLNQTSELTNSDTVNYLKGMSYYLLKKVDTSAFYFGSVSQKSNFYTASKFFESLNLSYSKKYNNALACFANFSADTVLKCHQLINISLAGNYLLLRDYQRFDSTSSYFLFDNYNYSNEQHRLIDLKNKLITLKRKSPFLAGALSAVVPGLGKFYVGKKGAGLAALATNTALAAIVFESYYRTKNFKSPQFITFGTLFTFFYVGNIFGSVYSVKQQIKSINGKITNEILASIHIPILRFYK
jgi:TM2 domain-containing membrane protein YozV